MKKSANQESCWDCPSSKLKPPGNCRLDRGGRPETTPEAKKVSGWTHNPLMWIAEVNDDPEDLRAMPRDIHEIAFEKGMILYIPDHRE